VSVAKTLDEIKERGVELWFEGVRLRFRAPKGALSAEDRAWLSGQRDTVIGLLRAEAEARRDVHPLSHSQRALWFIQQQAPESAAYHISVPARVTGGIDLDAVRQAFQALVDRHPMLRTTYGIEGDAPVQIVAGWVAAEVEFVEAADLSEEALKAAVDRQADRPFDIDNDLPLRLSVHSRAADDHILLLTAHHIAADGWSLLTLFDEFFRLYEEASGGRAAGLSKPTTDYAAYVRWQQDLLSGPEGERLWAYWREQLAEPRGRASLPVDRRPPALRSFAGAGAALPLSPALTGRLADLGQKLGVTPFVVWMAAFQAFLFRLTESQDVIVGTPTFGRSKAEFLPIIGDFVNSVPLRARMTAEMTFAELTAQLRQTTMEVLDAQEFPLSLLVQRLQPDRAVGGSPLFDTFFVLQRFDQYKHLQTLLGGETDAEPVMLGGLSLTPYPLTQTSAQFDLALQMVEVGDSICGAFWYSTEIFDRSTAEAFAADYVRLLDEISTDSHIALGALTPPSGTKSLDPAVTALIAELEARDVQISLEDGKLRLNAPKGALDDALKAKLSAHRDGLLTALQARAEADSKTGGIPPLPEGRRPELSFAQRRLWFMEQMDPGSVRYNIGGGVRLTGSIDTEILRLALEGVFARHEAFRTQILTEDGAARVDILECSRIPIEISDLSSTPQGERAAVAKAACAALVSTPLDLAAGIVARVRIITFAPDDHLLALSMHHIVSDGWSIAIVFRDICTAYDVRMTGAAPNLTPPRVRYVDFAAWEQDRAAAHGFDESSAYWRRALAGAPPLLDLPSDRPRPPNGSVRGARARIYIDEALVDRLEATARAHGATLFMALVGAWQTLLSRLSGQDDVVIGTTVANRDNVALEEVVGFLVNNVPVRGDLSGAPSFADLLTRTKLAVFGAFEHADLPFEALVEAVNPERTAAHAPIFQTLLTLLNYPMDSVGPGGSAMDPLELDVQAARFDLVLDLGRMPAGPNAGKMAAVYEYAADLFDEATILRWHAAFVRLLEAACAAPERSLSEVPLMPATEAEAFYRRLNDTALDHDRVRPTHALLQAAAQRHAEAVAIVAHDGQLTYAEFESRTNQLANLLVERGVKPGSRVAVCLERGLDLPVALAAAWKAGAAYVPLDPAHPSQRLGYVLEDADVACVVTTSAFSSIFEGVSAPLVQLDVDGNAIAGAPTASPGLEVAPDELAYVIYTSGSTGKPKGVEIEHRNLVAFLEAMKREPGLRAGETLLAVTTPSFDIAGLELWLPLSVGGKVLIASRQDTLDGKRLAGLLEEHGVAMLQATPATWRLMLESGWQGKADLTALCGGEAMPLDLARSLAPRVSALWNMYGPTETTIWSTTYRVTGDEGVIPIGGPIANTRIYVLDPSGAPSPIGAPGELVITGEGVTRGYRNRPELNAEKFVDVAPLGAPERAFRTGDLARWRSDGQLDFLGRGDGQVKIRGFRIELGEIEARLAGLPAVGSAVVAAREDTPGEKRLVAYVVMAPGATFDESQTRAALREILPDYMAPSAYMQLDRLPLSPNGKVDRKALPVPSASVGVATDLSDALMTPTQRNVAALWREVLRIDRVGLHQNFFDLGGHSLLLVKLQVALKASFGQEISIVELFQRTTVAAQAERFASPTRSADDALARARAKTRKTVHG
jgi:amino acid adenylation domain-containing protein